MTASARPLEPGEVALREEIETDVRAELEPEYNAERMVEVDRAKRAFVISICIVLWLAIPITAAIAGVSVRVFLLCSGLR